MAINFPNTPTLNETVVIGNITWTWTGSTWSVLSTAGGGGEAGGISNVVEDTTPQLGGDLDGLGNKVLFANVYDNLADLPSAATYHGMFAHVHATGKAYFAHAGAWVRLADYSEVSGGGGGGNAFSTIAVSGQQSVVADSATDTLTLVAGSGITITTTEASDSVTITGASSSVAFSDLTDLPSGLTIDKIAFQAITRLDVTNSGASAYLFDQYSGSNPTIYCISGTTIAFNLAAAGHPFLIQDGTGTNYNTGLYHVSTSGSLTTGASAQGKASGTLYWKVPYGISGGYRYQCSAHNVMVGAITVKAFNAI